MVLNTLPILNLCGVSCIHSPLSCTKCALQGLRSFAALPKFKLVRVFFGLIQTMMVSTVAMAAPPPPPYSQQVQSQISLGVTPILDSIAFNGVPASMQPLFDQLNNPNLIGAAFDTAVQTLVPTTNYALVQATKQGMNSAFNSAQYRIEKLRNLKPLGAEQYRVHVPEWPNNGLNYGDCDDDGGITGIWVKVYGSTLDQGFYQNVPGYYGDSVGYAIGADWGDMESGVVGLALSYTNNHTVGRSIQANVMNVESLQGTAYAWLSPMESMFVDVMLGFSTNEYDSRRNIAVNTFTTSAFAEFEGYQYAAQSDIGYAFIYDSFIVAPIARAKFSNLKANSYTEDGGSGGAALSVKNLSLNELIGGVGLKLIGSLSFAQARYVPEGTVMILYDFYADAQQTVSNFLAAGSFFPTVGPKPNHTTYLAELGITAYTYDNYSFYVKYDLQIGNRWHSFVNSGYMMLRGEWD